MKQFSSILLRWYDNNKRDLPWRRSKNPYHIWISEMMLQQTTVNAVVPFYERWIKTYPTVNDLACAKLEHVLKSWQGLGYYNRARNLHKSAAIVVDKFAGHLPNNPVLVRELPGFGPYSTASVLSIAFDNPLTIIDANVRRLVMRLLAIQAPADTKQDKRIEIFLKKVLPQKRAGDFNQALMEMGALICRNKEPLCNQCPLKSECQAFSRGIQEIIPTPKKKIITDVHAVIAIIKKGQKFFIQQRPSKGLLADLWEFPGGKIEGKEKPLDALRREIKEELNIDLIKARYLFDVKHFYTQFRVLLKVYDCKVQKYPSIHSKRRWASVEEMTHYPMPSGTARILKKLQNNS